MRAGRMNKLVQFQLLTSGGTDDWGQPVSTWVDQFQAYAALDPANWKTMAGAAETILSGATATYDLVTIEIHPDDRLQAGTWRALLGAVIYDIKATRLNNENDRMVLIATVGASNG